MLNKFGIYLSVWCFLFVLNGVSMNVFMLNGVSVYVFVLNGVSVNVVTKGI